MRGVQARGTPCTILSFRRLYDIVDLISAVKKQACAVAEPVVQKQEKSHLTGRSGSENLGGIWLMCQNENCNCKKPYYITTAIAYTSGKPHIGNTYEIVLADSIARFKREQC